MGKNKSPLMYYYKLSGLFCRTCTEMKISDLYCICAQQWRKIDTVNEIVTKAAQFTVDKINEYLKVKHMDGMCETLYLKKVIISIQIFSKSNCRIR